MLALKRTPRLQDQTSPKGLKVSIKVNNKAEVPYNDGTMYTLDEVNLIYKRRLQENSCESQHVPVSREKDLLTPYDKRNLRNGYPKQQKVFDSMPQSPEACLSDRYEIQAYRPIFFSGNRSTSEMSKPDNSRFYSSTDNLSLWDQDRTKSVPSNRILQGITQTEARKLCKEYTKLLGIIKYCRQTLSHSIDTNTRRNIENQYFTAMQRITTIEKTLGYDTEFAKRLVLARNRYEKENSSSHELGDVLKTSQRSAREERSRVMQDDSNYRSFLSRSHQDESILSTQESPSLMLEFSPTERSYLAPGDRNAEFATHSKSPKNELRIPLSIKGRSSNNHRTKGLPFSPSTSESINQRRLYLADSYHDTELLTNNESTASSNESSSTRNHYSTIELETRYPSAAVGPPRSPNQRRVENSKFNTSNSLIETANNSNNDEIQASQNRKKLTVGNRSQNLHTDFPKEQVLNRISKSYQPSGKLHQPTPKQYKEEMSSSQAASARIIQQSKTQPVDEPSHKKYFDSGNSNLVENTSRNIHSRNNQNTHAPIIHKPSTTSSNKQTILSNALKLRKKYLACRNDIKIIRKRLEDRIIATTEREKLEKEYFEKQIQRERIKSQLMKLASELKCDTKKFMQILKLDGDDLDGYSSRGSRRNDKSLNSVLELGDDSHYFTSPRENFSEFSLQRSDANGFELGRKRYGNTLRDCQNHEISDQHFDSNRTTFSADESYEPGDSFAKMGAEADSCGTNKETATRHHKPHRTDTDAKINGIEKQFVSSSVQTEDCIDSQRKDRRNSVILHGEDAIEDNAMPLYIEDDEFEDSKDLDDTDENNDDQFMQPSDTENLEKLRQKRLDFFRKCPQTFEDPRAPVTPVEIHPAVEEGLLEVKYTPLEYEQKFDTEESSPDFASQESPRRISRDEIISRLLLPTAPTIIREREAGFDLEDSLQSRFSKDPILHDVSDLFSQASDEDIKDEESIASLEGKLVSPHKNLKDANNNDLYEDESEEDSFANLKLYDVSDFTANDDVNSGSRKDIFGTNSEDDKVDIVSLAHLDCPRKYVIPRNNDDRKSPTSEFAMLHKQSRAYLENMEGPTDDDDNRSGESVVDVDYDSMFTKPDSEQKSIKLRLDSNAELDTECHRQVFTINDEDRETSPRTECTCSDGLDVPDGSKQADLTAPVQAVTLAEENKITASEISEEYACPEEPIEFFAFQDTEDGISTSYGSDSEDPIAKPVGTVDDEIVEGPKVPIPKLHELIKDGLVSNEADDFLDFVLDEEEMPGSSDALEEENEVNGTSDVLDEENEDVTKLKEQIKVETLPKESGLELSLKQSLDLLDELESFEEISDGEKDEISESCDDFNIQSVPPGISEKFHDSDTKSCLPVSLENIGNSESCETVPKLDIGSIIDDDRNRTEVNIVESGGAKRFNKEDSRLGNGLDCIELEKIEGSPCREDSPSNEDNDSLCKEYGQLFCGEEDKDLTYEEKDTLSREEIISKPGENSWQRKEHEGLLFHEISTYEDEDSLKNMIDLDFEPPTEKSSETDTSDTSICSILVSPLKKDPSEQTATALIEDENDEVKEATILNLSSCVFEDNEVCCEEPQGMSDSEEISERNNVADFSEMGNSAEISEKESSSEIQEGEDSFEISEMEDSFDISELEDSVKISELEASVESCEMEDSVEMSENDNCKDISEKQDSLGNMEMQDSLEERREGSEVATPSTVTDTEDDLTQNREDDIMLDFDVENWGISSNESFGCDCDILIPELGKESPVNIIKSDNDEDKMMQSSNEEIEDKLRNPREDSMPYKTRGGDGHDDIASDKESNDEETESLSEIIEECKLEQCKQGIELASLEDNRSRQSNENEEEELQTDDIVISEDIATKPDTFKDEEASESFVADEGKIGRNSCTDMVIPEELSQNVIADISPDVAENHRTESLEDEALENLKVTDESRAVQNDCLDIAILEEGMDPQEPIGIINPAVIAELQNEKTDLSENISPRPESGDLRGEYQARLDLLSLPVDLCDHLPLKLSSLASSDSDSNVFHEFQEKEDTDDGQSLSTDASFTDLDCSSSDSETEIQFGSGFSRDDAIKGSSVGIKALSHDQNPAASLARFSQGVDGDGAVDSSVDIKAVSHYQNPVASLVEFSNAQKVRLDDSASNSDTSASGQDVEETTKDDSTDVDNTLIEPELIESSPEANSSARKGLNALKSTVNNLLGSVEDDAENIKRNSALNTESVSLESSADHTFENRWFESLILESKHSIGRKSVDKNERQNDSLQIAQDDNKQSNSRNSVALNIRRHLSDIHEIEEEDLKNLTNLEVQKVTDNENIEANIFQETLSKETSNVPEEHRQLNFEQLEDMFGIDDVSEMTGFETSMSVEEVEGRELEEFVEFELMFDNENDVKGDAGNSAGSTIIDREGKTIGSGDLEKQSGIHDLEFDGDCSEVLSNKESGVESRIRQICLENIEKTSEMNDTELNSVSLVIGEKQSECERSQNSYIVGQDSIEFEEDIDTLLDLLDNSKLENKQSKVNNDNDNSETQDDESAIDVHTEYQNVQESGLDSEVINIRISRDSKSKEYAVVSLDDADCRDQVTRTKILPEFTEPNQRDDFSTPVVIDNGSGYTKAGLASGETPSIVIPAIIGRPNYEQVVHVPNTKEFYIGEEAERYRGMLKLSYPLEHGIVTNWDDMEKLWDDVLQHQLRIDPTEHPMLLTEAPLNPKKNRERMLEIMMETYQVPSFYIAIQAVMSLYVTGKTTGIVLDSGDGVTHIVPVYEGYSLPHATERMNIAGRDLTEYLMRILTERGYSFTTSAEKEICKDIKEKLCFVAEDFEGSIQAFESNSNKIKSYMMPDGQTIHVGNEQFRCPEILFQPNLIGKDIPGVHEYLYKSIQRCSLDLRTELYSNIVLSGGTTMLEGISNRLEKELGYLSNNKMSSTTKIHSLATRKFSVWCGAAALASMTSFSRMWITAEEYYDSGVDIVHRKCF